ncbi:flagellar biosynthetic protein FliO [Bartonella sp. HY329]|nr:flagellar biosynthetic protein FliO [Bartonella sp. HY329]UXM94081.1 flagellar biosynthetic protein FliO [Bartonella sp. HY329]
MNAWLTTQIGAEAAQIVSYAAYFVAAIIVLWVIILIIKRITRGTYVVGGKDREARLSVRDAAPIDSKRRLVLIKRDNIEHLILIGGPTDIVIETNISKLPLADNNSIGDLSITSTNNEQNQGLGDIFPTASLSTNIAATTTAPSSMVTTTAAQLDSSIAPQENLNIAEFNNVDAGTVSHIEQLQDTLHNGNLNTSIDYVADEPKVARAPQSDSNSVFDVATYKRDDIEKQTSPEYDSGNTEKTSPTVPDEERFEAENIAFNDGPTRINPHNQDLSEENHETAMVVVHDDQIHNDETAIEATDIQGTNSASQEPSLDKSSSKDDSDLDMSSSNKSNADFGFEQPFKSVETAQNTFKTEQNNSKRVSGFTQRDSFSLGSSSLKGNSQRSINQENNDRLSRQAAPQETSKQQVQDNPFRAPKPINPYKVMKAAGAFGNSNVNFNATISNAPLSKSNASNDKSKLSATNNERFGDQQVHPTISPVKRTEAATLLEKSEENLKDEAPKLKNDNNLAVAAKDSQPLKQMEPQAVRSDSELNGSTLKYQSVLGETAINKGSNAPSTKTSAQDNQPQKGFVPTEKSRPAQERPVAQRSVPQGMLRPPLMAKPRNAAVTAMNKQSKPVTGLDNAKNSQQTTNITENKSQTVTDNNTDTKKPSFINENKAVENEHNVDAMQQAKKESAKGKATNLQKFSLQLLEPQHILDKPNRNEQMTDVKIQQSSSTTSDEEDFDRRLKNELEQPVKK